MHFAELAATSGLFLVSITPFGVGLDRLAKRNLGFLGFNFQFIAGFKFLLDDVQVQIAHSGHHQFFGLRVAIEMEGWIFLNYFVQGTG